jgi:hypothetical protein
MAYINEWREYCFVGSTLTRLLHHLQVPVVSYIIRDSLKLKASDADTVHFLDQASTQHEIFLLIPRIVYFNKKVTSRYLVFLERL